MQWYIQLRHRPREETAEQMALYAVWMVSELDPNESCITRGGAIGARREGATAAPRRGGLAPLSGNLDFNVRDDSQIVWNAQNLNKI